MKIVLVVTKIYFLVLNFFPNFRGIFRIEVFSIKWVRLFRFNPRRQRGQGEGGGGVDFIVSGSFVTPPQHTVHA
jgi:hypothetical protein